MRVIETDHLEAAIAGGAAHVDVIPGIDQKSVRALRKIAGSNGLDNLVVLADQNPAAFRGPRTERVGDDRLEHSSADSALSFQQSALSLQGLCISAFLHFCIPHCTFSTAMAIPIPPPMQSAATP